MSRVGMSRLGMSRVVMSRVVMSRLGMSRLGMSRLGMSRVGMTEGEHQAPSIRIRGRHVFDPNENFYPNMATLLMASPAHGLPCS